MIAAEAANVFGRAGITSSRDEFTRFDHVPARELAVETQLHEAPRPQSGQQGSPSRQRVSQMMQHPGAYDDVERARQVAELQNVGLRVIDSAQTFFTSFSPRVGKAGKAQVDGEDARCG